MVTLMIFANHDRLIRIRKVIKIFEGEGRQLNVGYKKWKVIKF